MSEADTNGLNCHGGGVHNFGSVSENWILGGMSGNKLAGYVLMRFPVDWGVSNGHTLP